jgi:hypothetical protein
MELLLHPLHGLLVLALQILMPLFFLSLLLPDPLLSFHDGLSLSGVFSLQLSLAFELLHPLDAT